MAKYLFLDLYGVLTLDGCGVDGPYGMAFDAQAVENLRHIVEAVDPKIVITSTWRANGMEWLNDMWRHQSLPGEVYSATPMVERVQYEVVDPLHVGRMDRVSERYVKGLEVERWLQTNADKPWDPSTYRYAIVDDEPYFLMGQSSHFVLADATQGLTESVAQRIIQLLQ